MKIQRTIALISALVMIMALAVLGSTDVTMNGTITIPEDCNYVIAFCQGSVAPPYLNGNLMQTKASVAAQGLLKATSIHVSRFPTVADLPFVMNGADAITFAYLSDAVCTRAGTVSGYSELTGSVTGPIVSSVNDLLFGMVLGSNGQVTITGDTVGLTLLSDSLKCRIGYLIPGDSSVTCLASDASALSGYWFTPEPIYHKTTTSVLVEPGHYEFNPVLHTNRYVFIGMLDGSYMYERYTDGVLGGTTGYSTYKGASFTTYFYTYPGVWVPDRYETKTTGWWEYPEPVWVVTGTAGQVSGLFISISDTMIGAVYVSRPLMS